MPVAVSWSRRVAVGTVLLTGGHLIGVPALAATAATVLVGLALIVGVPHGAVDHLMAERLTGRVPLPLVVVGYAGTAGAAWALLQWGGPAAFLAVIALSGLHFGLGELEVARELTGWRPARLTAAAIVIAGSGALALPLARSGDQFAAVADAISPQLAQALGAAPVQFWATAGWAGAALIAVAASLRSGHPGVALDIGLIGLLGVVAPPLVAFAVWFGGWHALRHSARMLTVEPGCSALLAAGRRRAAVRRLARLAAPSTIAALATVAVLGWYGANAGDPVAVLAVVLNLLLALTVPHMVVVMWLDRTAGTGRNTAIPRPSPLGSAQ